MLRIFPAIFLLISLAGVCEGCSCAPTHPQEHYCSSDFVIRAKIKKEFLQDNNATRVYKVRIGKEYRMTDKAWVALKSGRIQTPAWDSVCGKYLEPGKVYVLSGRIISLKARITLCDFSEPWHQVSKRQRRGFQRMYKVGCDECKIKRCTTFGKKCAKTKHTCNWDTFTSNRDLDCQRIHGICLPSSNGSCAWTKTKLQTACKKNRAKVMSTSKPHQNQPSRRVDHQHFQHFLPPPTQLIPQTQRPPDFFDYNQLHHLRQQHANNYYNLFDDSPKTNHTNPLTRYTYSTSQQVQQQRYPPINPYRRPQHYHYNNQHQSYLPFRDGQDRRSAR